MLSTSRPPVPLRPNRYRACLPTARLRAQHHHQTTRCLGRRQYISPTSTAQPTPTIHTKGRRPRPTCLPSHSILNLTRPRPTDRPLASHPLLLHHTTCPTLPHAHSSDPPWTRLIRRLCLTDSDYPPPANVSILSDDHPRGGLSHVRLNSLAKPSASTRRMMTLMLRSSRTARALPSSAKSWKE